MNTNTTRRIITILALALALCATAAAQSIRYAFAAHSATGTKAAIDVTRVMPHKHTASVIVTGTPATCVITLEGSIDGTNFFDISGNQTCTASLMFHVVEKPVLYVRPNLTTLTGGSSPTVTLTYLGLR